MTSINDDDHYILLRKLRKKLRQIENLENLSRTLNEQELIKVTSKDQVRQEILKLSEEDATNPIQASQNEQTEDLIIIDNENEDEVLATEKIQIPTSEVKSEKIDRPPDWNNTVFAIRTLSGHNDITTCVAVDEDLLISCSRDTTVKVWNASTGKETTSLRGHTGSVTCVILLSVDDGDKLLWYMGSHVKSRVAVTGSVDCMVKIWMLDKGQAFKSFYTYNEITCIGYLSSHRFIVTGTNGGKLELWNAVTSQNLSSVTSYGDGFTNMKVSDNRVYTSSSEGFISVWQLQEEELQLLFSSEKLFINDSIPQIPRKIHSVLLIGNLIYYGDDGTNIKILNWETGEIEKLANHTYEFGSTDAICSTEGEIFCSSYNLDFGYGSVNVRSLPQNEYLTSLGNGETGRIFSMAVTRTKSGKIRLITAGVELKVWDAISSKFPRKQAPDIRYMRTKAIEEYSLNAVNSDYESSESETGNSDSEDAWEPGSRIYIPREIKSTRSIFSWCSIL